METLDSLEALGEYHGVRDMQLHEWLHRLFHTTNASFTYTLTHAFRLIGKGYSVVINWEDPRAHIQAEDVRDLELRYHGIPPQAALGIRLLGLRPSTCATGMRDRQVAVLFATPSMQCALGYAPPFSFFGKLWSIVLVIHWHCKNGNPADRLSSLRDRKYTQNRLPPGDYDIHHIRFVCVSGFPQAKDLSQLTSTQARHERMRERQAMAYTATEAGYSLNTGYVIQHTRPLSAAAKLIKKMHRRMAQRARRRLWGPALM